MTAMECVADSWTILNAFATVLMALVAVVGLVFVIYQLRQNSRALQIQAFESVFKDIRDFENTWIEKKFDSEMSTNSRKAWCASFFNTIEYLCYLMNHKMVRHKELREFFILGLRHWHEQFRTYISQGLINDTTETFQEFKKLCKKEKIIIS